MRSKPSLSTLDLLIRLRFPVAPRLEVVFGWLRAARLGEDRGAADAEESLEVRAQEGQVPGDNGAAHLHVGPAGGVFLGVGGVGGDEVDDGGDADRGGDADAVGG